MADLFLNRRNRWVAGILAVVFAGPAAGQANAREPAAPDETPTQLINRVLAAAWKANNVTPPRRTTDAEFARKLYLDLLGRVPTADELAAFEKDPAANKRAKLIDRLLPDGDCAAHWAEMWTATLLPAEYNPLYRKQFHKWLTGRLAARATHDDIVKQLLTATGKNDENGAVHFVLANLGNPLPEEKWAESGQFDMVPVTSRTGRVFLGLGFQCLACHDHPFDASIRQRDFWGINAFFRQAERSGEPCASEGVAAPLGLSDNPKFNPDGVVRFKRRTGVVNATGLTFLKDRGPRGGDDRPRRAILADYIVKHTNFAPTAVNRVWTTLLGRGLLEQAGLDELGEHNEPLHPELLAGLAAAFKEGGYDQRKLIAWICASDVYQLHTPPGTGDDPYFFRRGK